MQVCHKTHQNPALLRRVKELAAIDINRKEIYYKISQLGRLATAPTNALEFNCLKNIIIHAEQFRFKTDFAFYKPNTTKD